MEINSPFSLLNRLKSSAPYALFIGSVLACSSSGTSIFVVSFNLTFSSTCFFVTDTFSSLFGELSGFLLGKVNCFKHMPLMISSSSKESSKTPLSCQYRKDLIISLAGKSNSSAISSMSSGDSPELNLRSKYK